MSRRMFVDFVKGFVRVGCLVTALLVYGGLTFAADVTVDARTVHVINGESRVPKGLFGGTAFCNTGEFAKPDLHGSVLARELRLGMVRIVANLEWWLPQDRPAPMPDDPLSMFNIDLYNRGEGAHWNTLPFPLGHVLRNFRDNLEAEPLLIIGDNTGPGWLVRDKIPLDAREYAEILAAFVRLAKRDYPALKYVHMVNEPNAYWFKHFREPAKVWIDYFLTIARRLHREFPDISVGGPVLCWPPHYPPSQKGMPNWYTWEEWSKPIIDATGRELGFFDYHYGTTPEEATFSLEIITAEAMRAHRYWLKTIISEANPDYMLSGEPLTNLSKLLQARTLTWERYLFSLLRQRDKLLGSLWHDLGGPSAFNLCGTAHKAEYWVLWIFRNLRGEALWTVMADPMLPAYASIEGRRITVVVWNDSEQSRTVTLDLLVPQGMKPKVTAERLEWDLVAEGGRGKVVCGPMSSDSLRIERLKNALRITWRATPWGTYAVYATMPNGFAPDRVVIQREFFGDSVMGELSQAKPQVEVEVTVPADAVRTAQNIALRVGLLDVARDGQITLSVGRRNIPLPQPRKGFAVVQQVLIGGKPGAAIRAPSTHTGNFELAAPFITSGRNRVRLTASFRKHDQAVRIGYVSVVTVSRPARATTRGGQGGDFQ